MINIVVITLCLTRTSTQHSMHAVPEMKTIDHAGGFGWVILL